MAVQSASPQTGSRIAAGPTGAPGQRSASPAAGGAGSLGNDPRLRGFALLIELEKRARHAGSDTELGFIFVNETHNLVRYRQALLWEPAASGSGRVLAVSGLAAPDNGAPFIAWARRMFAALAPSATREITSADLPADLAEGWAASLPAQGLMLPLPDRAGRPAPVLALFRDEAFSAGDKLLLEAVADAYGHAWQALRAQPSWRRSLQLRGRRLAVLAAIAIALCGFIPIQHSVIAPAEVIARDPVMVRSSVEGVVEEVRVRPNELVTEGQPLLVLDDARIANRLEVARKALEVAAAEFRQASQKSLFDADSKATLVVLRGRMEQHAAEVAYLEDLTRRIEIRAPRDGVVIFDDVNDWIGRPVALGERIMMVADPAEVEIEVQLPTADAIEFASDARVRLFLNVGTLDPIDAQIRHASYQATMNPAGVFAYRLVAGIAPDQTLPRLGLKGSAKVYGKTTVLAAYLFRRPYAAVRQWLGL